MLSCLENHFCRKNSGGTESKPSDGSVATADEHEVFRRVSSLVAKYQEQAITEKQSRVFAQLQAMEKVGTSLRSGRFH